MKRRVSQREIARMLGVNASTVSRALNGDAGVSPDLRKRVVGLAAELGYRPNPFAMSLRHDSSRLIGIIVPDLAFSHYAHIVKFIEAEARKAGYMCVITDSADSYEGELGCVERLENLRVEGIIMCLSQDTVDFSHLQRLTENHVALVLFDRVADANYSSVTINDTFSARQVTLHLLEGGSRRIAFVSGPNSMRQTTERKHGYLEALRERGIAVRKELVKCIDLNFNSGLAETLDLLDLPEPPDAILAANGLLALAVFQAVVSRGLRVPDDIAIIGFMSDWVSGMAHPRLTFVKQNLKEIGAKTFKLLSDQLNGDRSVQHVVVNARLEVRESTKKQA